MTWWPALLGWPAMAVAAVLVTVGLQRRNEYWILGALVPLIPIGLYVLGSPFYWWLPILVVVTLMGLAVMTMRARAKTARNADVS